MINITKIKPLANHIVTTMNRYEEDQTTNGIVTDLRKKKGAIKEYQTVVAKGPFVSDAISIGDTVLINPMAYGKPKHKAKADSITGLMTGDEVEMVFDIPNIDINGVPHLFIYDRDVEFVFEYEELPDTKSLLYTSGPTITCVAPDIIKS